MTPTSADHRAAVPCRAQLGEVEANIRRCDDLLKRYILVDISDLSRTR